MASFVPPREAPVMECGASTCSKERPVCCIETPGGANPGATFCAATWEGCETDPRDAFFHACNRPEDCPSGELCCHVEAKGERCAATCEAPNATVCGKEEDCPAKDVDGVPLIECAPEMGAYVQGTYGLCRYRGL